VRWFAGSGKIPEYLSDERQISVKAKSNQAVWFTINIPKKSHLLLYRRNTVKVSRGGEASGFVTIYPLTLRHPGTLR